MNSTSLIEAPIGRVSYDPTVEINLSDFLPPIAVIDRLEIIIYTCRPTQFQHIQDHLKLACDLQTGSRRPWSVTPINPGAGNVTREFIIRLHDTDIKTFFATKYITDSIERKFGSTYPAKIHLIEIALDFQHRSNDETLTRAMFQHLAGRNSLGISQPIQYREGSPPARLQTYRERILSEGTVYYGDRCKDEVFWKAYFKQWDNITQNSKSLLPREQWRARIEATLQRGAPGKFGMTLVDDLKDFKFEALARKLFHFREIKPIDDSLAIGSRPKLLNLIIVKQQQICDVTLERGMVSLEKIGRRDKRGRLRAHSSHGQADKRLNEKSRRALRTLSDRFSKNSAEN